MPQISMFTWGAFPYICLAVMIVGTLYRYQSDQSRPGSTPSESLEKKLLTVGSMLFTVGILVVLAVHVAGLLVPMQVYTALGISAEVYHGGTLVLGGVSGLVALAGISLLLYRRIANSRVRRTSDVADFVSDGLLWAVIFLGLAFTLGYSVVHGPYEYRATVGPWLRSVLTLQPDVALMAGVPLLLQAHIVLAFFLVGISPFTRLMRLYSVSLGYLARAPLVYHAQSGYGYGYDRGYGNRQTPLRERLAILSIEPQAGSGRPPLPDEEPQAPEPVGPFERALRESLDPLAASCRDHRC